LANGERIRGTLMGIEGEQIVVNVRTRIPEPPRTLPFSSILSLDLDNAGLGVGKIVAIAAGIAGAVVLGLVLLAYALAD